MTTAVNICNQALLLLGEQVLQSLEEDTNQAKVCSAYYDTTIDHCIRDLKPSFAKRRTTLTMESNPPSWGFDKAYDLPQGSLAVLMLDTESLQDRQYKQWRVEGNQFVTDRTEPNILYLERNQETESLMDASFIKAAAAYLAYEIAYALTNSNDKVAAMFELDQIRADDARAVYGMESSTVRTKNEQLTIVR